MFVNCDKIVIDPKQCCGVETICLGSVSEFKNVSVPAPALTITVELLVSIYLNFFYIYLLF
jgi:hypothetical protein